MRLFIAINFSEEEKASIDSISKILEENASQGRLVGKEHMHLTLEFLGDTPKEKLKSIKKAMDRVDSRAFTMELSQLGYFKRRDGNIYWLGIRDNPLLMDLQGELHNLLAQEGFQLQNRPYKPHITLGRRVRLKGDFKPEILTRQIGKVRIQANSIDLVKSEFRDGRLVYTIVYSREL